MTPDQFFQLANPLALLGWLALAFSPKAPRLAQFTAAIAVPVVLSVGYTALVLAHWSSSTGDFNSLDGVAALFENRWLLLAGWVHYLAFDLLVGAWEARTARREGIPPPPPAALPVDDLPVRSSGIPDVPGTARLAAKESHTMRAAP